MKEKLKKIFVENGIFITSGQESAVLELDSIQYISLLVSIEEEFDVEIPEEYILQSLLQTFNDYYELVEELCS